MTASGDRSDPLSSLERAVRFIRHGLEMTADKFHPIDAGIVLSTPSLPAVFGVNQLRISRPVRFAGALELAERHMGRLPFWHVVVEHDAAGAQLEEQFRVAGWKRERDLLMALSRNAHGRLDTTAVIEPDEERMVAMMIRWHLDAHPNAPAEEVRQLAEYARREGRVRDDRRLAIATDDGDLAAITKLRSDGRTAQVEDVYTVPEARGRGYARALVAHAVALARGAAHELIFIVADDDDWPQQLYRRIGFEPIGRIRSFHLDLGIAR